MVYPITVTGTNPIPAASGKKLVSVSTDALDDQNVYYAGLVAGVGTLDGISLAGKREKLSAQIFATLDSVSMSSNPSGIVTVREEGTSAVGYTVGLSNPADGDTVGLGLTGFVQTYTFRSLASLPIVAKAQGASGFATGDYFDITDKSGTVHRLWYNINSGGGAPSNPGTLNAVLVATSDTAIAVATATVTAINTLTGTYKISADNAGSSSATVTVSQSVLGTMSVADGTPTHDTGFTFATIAAGTASAANQVAIGTTATATMLNLKRAINVDGTAGTDYATGTTANAFVSAAASGTTVTYTDLIKCARALSWACTSASGALAVIPPVGGTNGALLATLVSGNNFAFNSLSFDNEAMGSSNLPALYVQSGANTPQGGCDPIRAGGGGLTIEALHGGGGGLSWKVQTSTDQGTTWRDAATPADDLVSGVLARYTIAEHVEFFRVVITANPATAVQPLHMKAVFGA